jgi:hypothetical protein
MTVMLLGQAEPILIAGERAVQDVGKLVVGIVASKTSARECG